MVKGGVDRRSLVEPKLTRAGIILSFSHSTTHGILLIKLANTADFGQWARRLGTPLGCASVFAVRILQLKSGQYHNRESVTEKNGQRSRGPPVGGTGWALRTVTLVGPRSKVATLVGDLRSSSSSHYTLGRGPSLPTAFLRFVTVLREPVVL